MIYKKNLEKIYYWIELFIENILINLGYIT